MSDKFPLSSDAFSGGSRLTAQQSSEGRDGAPLFELLNTAAAEMEGAPNVIASSPVNWAALTAAQIADLNRGVSTNNGAAREIDLPAIADVPAGWTHTFIALSVHNFTIDPNGSETINGSATSRVLGTAAGEWMRITKLTSSSTEWIAIGGTVL